MKQVQLGQSLIEMIVVIGVVIVLVTGIIAGTTVTLSRSRDSNIRSAAVRYAQEGIELARSQRDSGWTAFAALGTPYTTYCVDDNGVFTATGTSCTTPNVTNLYVRSVNLELKDAGNPTLERMAVDVVVQWGDLTNSSNVVELKTDLTQWK